VEEEKQDSRVIKILPRGSHPEKCEEISESKGAPLLKKKRKS